MPLHIRDERAAQMARKLAARRGQSMTEVVIAALEGELVRDREHMPLVARLAEIAADLAQKGDVSKARPVGKVEVDGLWGHD